MPLREAEHGVGYAAHLGEEPFLVGLLELSYGFLQLHGLRHNLALYVRHIRQFTRVGGLLFEQLHPQLRILPLQGLGLRRQRAKALLPALPLPGDLLAQSLGLAS